jgi:hypothetical protein
MESSNADKKYPYLILGVVNPNIGISWIYNHITLMLGAMNYNNNLHIRPCYGSFNISSSSMKKNSIAFHNKKGPNSLSLSLDGPNYKVRSQKWFIQSTIIVIIPGPYIVKPQGIDMPKITNTFGFRPTVNGNLCILAGTGVGLV